MVVPGFHPADGGTRHRADYPAGHGRCPSPGRDLYRRGRPGDAVEAREYFEQEAGRTNTKVASRDACQPDLLREGAVAAGSREPPDPPGRFPEPRVLQGAGDADVGVGQAARHRPRPELSAAHRTAAP